VLSQRSLSQDAEKGKRFVKKLELLRRSHGLTQQQVADATGVARSRLSLMERGRAIPPKGGVELQRLATFFSLPVSEHTALLDEVCDEQGA
jgi:transcriptional regulator with XRE-family HTH domain